MSDFLFDEFKPVSAKEWKQKIQVDLKGADYNETLLWKTNDGITVRPFYHSDDFVALEPSLVKEGYSICQSIFVDNEDKANKLAVAALEKGADAIHFFAEAPFDIDMLLYHRPIQAGIKLYFNLSFLSEDFCKELISKSQQYHVYVTIDIVGNLTKTGNWFVNSDSDHTSLRNVLVHESDRLHVLSVDAKLYQNAGATPVQQVAYALAHGNEYLNFLSNASVNQVKKMLFQFSVGSNYFFEIAKLRAFRHLWQILTKDYGMAIDAELLTTPSLRNKTLYDYNVNMLRTTTECMSAILGGSNAVSNRSYDSFFHKSNAFGERIARNQLLILKNESYLKEASNLVNGSYYIESLTFQIAEKALAIFKDIEKSGGFIKQLTEGTIQRKIEESAQKERKQFTEGEIILLGTNKHPNPQDTMKDELEIYPFMKKAPRKTILKPIIPKRLAEDIEQERIEKE